MQRIKTSLKKWFERVKNRGLFVQPERVFLWSALVFGVVFVVATPPFQAPDEQAHFFRAYQVSEFKFIPKQFEINGKERFGGELPASLDIAAVNLMKDIPGNPTKVFDVRLYGEYLTQKLEPSYAYNIAFEGAAIYSPVSYAPQAVGIGIGRLFEASPLLLIWLGRLGNLLVWVCLVYFAVRLLPFAKWLLILLALNPLTLFLAASLSADAITIGMAFLFVSLVVASLKGGVPLSNSRLSALALLPVGLGLTKPVNFLFAVLLLCIPWSRFKTKKRYILFCVGTVLLTLLASLGWSALVREAIIITGQVQRPGSGIDPGAQLSFILHHPFSYVKTLITNYVFITPGGFGDSVVRSYFGILGWLDTLVPLWVMLLYMAGLVVTAMYQLGRGLVLSLWQKALMLGMFLASSVASITALYLNYTPVGAHVVEGVQGRYFMPYVVALISIFTGRKKVLDISERTIGMMVTCLIVLVLSTALVAIVIRYYL